MFKPPLFIGHSEALNKNLLVDGFLELQPRFGGKALKFQAVCPQNGTAALKGLNTNNKNWEVAFSLHSWEVFPRKRCYFFKGRQTQPARLSLRRAWGFSPRVNHDTTCCFGTRDLRS